MTTYRNKDVSEKARTLETDLIDAIELKFPGAARYIAVARQAADAIGIELGISPDERSAIRLAVGEACNNAVFHLQGKSSGSKPPYVSVAFRISDTDLEIDVGNEGVGAMPPHGGKMPDPLAENGRGLALMEAMMDSVEYLSRDGRTIVRMRKHRGTDKI